MKQQKRHISPAVLLTRLCFCANPPVCSFFMLFFASPFKSFQPFTGNPSYFPSPSLRITVPSVCFAGVCGWKDASSSYQMPHYLLSYPFCFSTPQKILFPLHLPLCSVVFLFFFPQVKFSCSLPLSLLCHLSPSPRSPCSLLSQRSQPVIGRVYE